MRRVRADDFDFYGASYGSTIDVIETETRALVTYRGDNGERFSVIVRKKPNPIGFTAKLPGCSVV